MILISKDSKGKIRVVEINYTFVDPIYVITRLTGLFGGKIVKQPDILVERGKVKRTLLQQVELEFNSKVKSYLDKGYEIYSDLTDILIGDITEEQITALVGNEKTNQAGIIKPMLAKDYNKCSINVLEQDWYGSRKIDGVRALFSWDGEKIIVSSRGGGDYNGSTTHLTGIPQLVNYFQNHPNYILDGELYKHGLPLQTISGIARLEKPSERTEQLEFWIYDIVDLDDLKAGFEDRLELLGALNVKYLGLPGFDPFSPLKLKMVPHKKMNGFAAIDLNHDRYVKEGFEGIVIRDPEKEYGPGKRDNRMLKFKKYMDDEFEITGFEEGLRDEDFVFTCITEDGKDFKAKPIGTREIKDDYRNNMKDIIGKRATVKFFYYSEEGKPLQPTLKSIRGYGE